MKNLGKSTTTKNKQNNVVLWLIMIATIKISAKLQSMNSYSLYLSMFVLLSIGQLIVPIDLVNQMDLFDQ